MRWSVVIPLYNRTTYLKTCLSSVLSQRPSGGGEILIWDDGSIEDPTDAIDTILRDQPTLSWDIVLHRQPKNLGMFANFNDAISNARGDWVHILCEDDYVTPEFYQFMGAASDRQAPGVGAVACSHANLYEPEKFLDKRPPLAPEGIVENMQGILKVCNPFQIPAVVFRRSALQAVGGFSLDWPFTGDWELYRQLASAYEWYYIPQAMAVFRVHPASQSNALRENQAEEVRMMQALEV